MHSRQQQQKMAAVAEDQTKIIISAERIIIIPNTDASWATKE